MKSIATLLLVSLFTLSGVTTAGAVLKTVGEGDSLNIDRSMIPADQQQGYVMFQKRCVKCHTLERAVVALKTGVAPITGGVFNRSATKSYGIKMLRKKDSGMTKPEVAQVVDLLNYLLDTAQRH